MKYTMEQWKQRKENIRRHFKDQIIFPNPEKEQTFHQWLRMKKAQQANYSDMAEIGVKFIKQYMKANKKIKNRMCNNSTALKKM